jgi:hypothetical protein
MCPKNSSTTQHLRLWNFRSQIHRVLFQSENLNQFTWRIVLSETFFSFSQKPLDDFCLPVKQCRNWFTLDEIKTKRSEIAKVIESLAREQNPNNVFEYPDLTIIGEDSCSGKGYLKIQLKTHFVISIYFKSRLF